MTLCENEFKNAEVNAVDAGVSPKRREMMERFQLVTIKALIHEALRRGLDDHPSVYRLADTLTTAPEGLRDPELALRLARRAVELTPDDTMCHQSLGWARYRAGDWKGCIESLEKTRSYAAEGDFFGAMALWHLGDEAKARDAFDRAETWLKGYEKKWEEAQKKGVFLASLSPDRTADAGRGGGPAGCETAGRQVETEDRFRAEQPSEVISGD